MTIDFFRWRRRQTGDERREYEQAIAGDLDQRDEPGTTGNAASVPEDGAAASVSSSVLAPGRSGQGVDGLGMVRTLDGRRVEAIGLHPRRSVRQRMRLYETLNDLGRVS